MNAYCVPGIDVINNHGINHEYICELVLNRLYNKTIADISENTRQRDILELRQVVQVILCRYSNMSLGNIGLVTGHKNHATVLHSKAVIRDAEQTMAKYHVESSVLKIYIEFETEYKNYFTINNLKTKRKPYEKCTRSQTLK